MRCPHCDSKNIEIVYKEDYEPELHCQNIGCKKIAPVEEITCPECEGAATYGWCICKGEGVIYQLKQLTMF